MWPLDHIFTNREVIFRISSHKNISYNIIILFLLLLMPGANGNDVTVWIFKIKIGHSIIMSHR